MSFPHSPPWADQQRRLPVAVFMSDGALATSDVYSLQELGFEPSIISLPSTSALPDGVRTAAAVLIEVDNDNSQSTERFNNLIRALGGTPVVAAMRNLSVEALRVAMRAGAADVLPLPFSSTDLKQVFDSIRLDLSGKTPRRPAGKLISMIGSSGGVGVTSLMVQIAAVHAGASSTESRPTCVLDLDLQFGNAALYLGDTPALSFKDVLEAGSRVDGSLLRSTAAEHTSGLRYIPAPQEIMPLESLTSDQALTILDLAAAEFDTVFLDLPRNWTNWSLTALARCDLILLVVDFSVASLHRARRQLDMLKEQGISDVPIKVLVNRVERRLFRTINVDDVRDALREEVAFTVIDDAATFKSALDQGVLVTELDPRGSLSKDLRKVASSLVEIMAGDKQHVAS